MERTLLNMARDTARTARQQQLAQRKQEADRTNELLELARLTAEAAMPSRFKH